MRDRSGNRFRALGLMISKAPEAYFELAPGAKPRVRPASPPEAAPAGAGGDLLPFRIRVKARGAPRTRTLCLSAASEREARALAVADLVGDWDALEVESS